MNVPMIRYVLCWAIEIEGLFLMLPCMIAGIYGEQVGTIYFLWGGACIAAGYMGVRRKVSNTEIYPKEGMVTVALVWIVMSLFGAAPFVFSGEIPNYVDALFEIVSGFTTTGASILSNVEGLTHASLFWRSFSHWVGGMGVLVFILMLIPVRTGSQMNLMRAESPGYNVSKFVPRVRGTARILYKIYLVLTLTELVILLVSRMYWFDAVCLTFGTAGTGGFAVLNSGCAGYTAFQQYVLAIFMILFGVNFSFYFLFKGRRRRMAFKMDEVRVYVILIGVSVLLISLNTFRIYGGAEETFRAALFQVGSIITTTGFSTTDFDLWPSFSKNILIMLMCIGACAGSTGGGFKVSRVIVMVRSAIRRLATYINPKRVRKIQMDGETLNEDHVRGVEVFLVVYVMVFALSVLVVSLDGFGFETNFTAVAATLNNIGPGLADVGPTANYSMFSIPVKLVLILDMLAGRLELFPLLILLYPPTWKSR
ncbi:MAG: TrkH family potassium uptake protein [Eubacterium sp.]|nr:TrkH family potassium uptake protein [Eubacterium sp.]